MRSLRPAALLLVLALAAMATPVAATEGSLRVESLVHDGPASQAGDLAMLFVQDEGADGEASEH